MKKKKTGTYRVVTSKTVPKMLSLSTRAVLE